MPHPAVGVVVLAGDIGIHTKGLRWARAQWPETEIVFVAGNHEFYGQNWDDTMTSLRQEAAELKVHFLERDSVVLSGVRFLGTALWTDFELYGKDRAGVSMAVAANSMNDYRLISLKRLRHDETEPGIGRDIPLTPDVTRKWCLQSRAWLEEMLADPFAGPTVVVTHHVPHRGSIPARFAGDPMNPSFTSDLSALMGPAALWIHGHTHDSADHIANGTRVLCNPRGYPLRDGGVENKGFIPDLVAEISRST